MVPTIDYSFTQATFYMFSKANFSDQDHETSLPIIQAPKSTSLPSENTMYPKVKVKEQEEDDPLADFDTYYFNSPVSEYEDDSPTSVVRIPDSYVSSLAPSSQEETKSGNKKKPVETTSTTENIRASPILPPRAVLSSPDNDGLMRSKNKGKGELVSGLKDHNSCENRHVRCKAIPRRSSFEATTQTTKQEPKETLETKPNLTDKTRARAVDTKQRAHERKQRPDWV